MPYLDYNATTPVLPEVVDAMLPYLRQHFGNPSSSHVYGQRTRKAVERAREQVAALLECSPAEIVFTSGGTESNNLAIRGAARRTRPRLVTSMIEHPATEMTCAALVADGYALATVPVDSDGRVDPARLADEVTDTTSVVTVMLANNEVGTIQPVAEIADIARRAGAVIHTDAAQAVGKIPVSVDELGVDLLSVAGHKLYAPKGVGALYVRDGVELEPITYGASHEGGLRPGTENVASIVGLGKACEIARQGMQESFVHLKKMRDELWERLQASVPGLSVNGSLDHALPNTLNVCFPEVFGPDLLAQAEEVAASTGSACHEGSESVSSVLSAMGIPPAEARGAVRLSVGRMTTPEEVAEAAEALVEAWEELV